jgi:hypothetical protein
MRELKTLSTLPWMVVGDFNECLWQEEHISWTPRSVNQMDDFREALFDCNLSDLGFQVFRTHMTTNVVAEPMFVYSWIERWPAKHGVIVLLKLL